MSNITLKGYRAVRNQSRLSKSASDGMGGGYNPTAHIEGSWGHNSMHTGNPTEKQIDELGTPAGQARQDVNIAANKAFTDFMTTGRNWSNAFKVPVRALVSQPFYVLDTINMMNSPIALFSPAVRKNMFATRDSIYRWRDKAYNLFGLHWDPKTSGDARNILENFVQPATEFADSLALATYTPFKEAPLTGAVPWWGKVINNLYKGAVVGDDYLQYPGDFLHGYLSAVHEQDQQQPVSPPEPRFHRDNKKRYLEFMAGKGSTPRAIGDPGPMYMPVRKYRYDADQNKIVSNDPATTGWNIYQQLKY